MAPDLVRKAKVEMDKCIAGSMPENWHGHARLRIFDSDLTGKKEEFALRLSERVSEKRPEASGDAVAELAIEKTQEKLG